MIHKSLLSMKKHGCLTQKLRQNVRKADPMGEPNVTNRKDLLC